MSLQQDTFSWLKVLKLLYVIFLCLICFPIFKPSFMCGLSLLFLLTLYFPFSLEYFRFQFHVYLKYSVIIFLLTLSTSKDHYYFNYFYGSSLHFFVCTHLWWFLPAAKLTHMAVSWPQICFQVYSPGLSTELLHDMAAGFPKVSIQKKKKKMRGHFQDRGHRLNITYSWKWQILLLLYSIH